ncbi:hypothetical protein NPIL_157661 [Nephila pilipes]|uniref:Uncharacterized protein n=1 Tax=Nephila pilipes TaxID=299642 RepID=A0A8X6TQV0_NEPPI|nr:hypothetical protein NPIL_157661 [Nephila pilipes]
MGLGRENEQQFENALTVQIACSEHEDGAVIVKEASLDRNVEVPFECYEDTSSNYTVKLRAASVGTKVRIPVPEVDSGRRDARSTLAVVMENTGERIFPIRNKR